MAGSAVQAAERVGSPRLYRIDPSRSLATFSVRFLGITTVHGSLGGIGGTMVLSAEPKERSLRARASAEDIRTGLGARDWHLRTRNYFDARQYPEITFQATRIEQLGDRVRIAGALTLRGVARELEVEARLVRGDAAGDDDMRVRYEAEFAVDRRAFAVATGGRMRRGWHPADLLIGREVKARVVLEAARVG